MSMPLTSTENRYERSAVRLIAALLTAAAVRASPPAIAGLGFGGGVGIAGSGRLDRARVLQPRSGGDRDPPLGAIDGALVGTTGELLLERIEGGAVGPGESGVAVDWPTQPVASSVDINSVTIRPRTLAESLLRLADNAAQDLAAATIVMTTVAFADHEQDVLRTSSPWHPRAGGRNRSDVLLCSSRQHQMASRSRTTPANRRGLRTRWRPSDQRRYVSPCVSQTV
jgi:hypothetical protein